MKGVFCAGGWRGVGRWQAYLLFVVIQDGRVLFWGSEGVGVSVSVFGFWGVSCEEVVWWVSLGGFMGFDVGDGAVVCAERGEDW